MPGRGGGGLRAAEGLAEPKISIMPTMVPNRPSSVEMVAMVPRVFRKRSSSRATARPASSTASLITSRELRSFTSAAAKMRPMSGPRCRRFTRSCVTPLAWYSRMVAGSTSRGATSEVRRDQKRSPMIASVMTEVMMMSQIGQPAASMIDSTRGFLPRNAVDFSPPTMIPQGLVRVAAREHKDVGNPLDAIRIAKRLRPLIPCANLAGGERHLENRFVRCPELAGHRCTNVANHPQSLWITLWTAFRVESQVTYRKGLFFDRSNFERCVFYITHQVLTVFFPIEANRVLGAAPRVGAMVRRRWIDESLAPEEKTALAPLLRAISARPTRRLLQFLRDFSR